MITAQKHISVTHSHITSHKPDKLARNPALLVNNEQTRIDVLRLRFMGSDNRVAGVMSSRVICLFERSYLISLNKPGVCFGIKGCHNITV